MVHIGHTKCSVVRIVVRPVGFGHWIEMKLVVSFVIEQMAETPAHPRKRI